MLTLAGFNTILAAASLVDLKFEPVMKLLEAQLLDLLNLKQHLMYVLAMAIFCGVLCVGG